MDKLTQLFSHLINLNRKASVIILVVILIRQLIRNLPKKYAYGLWGIVGFRLCFPFSVSSVFSIFNYVPMSTRESAGSEIGILSEIEALPVLPDTQTPAPLPSVTHEAAETVLLTESRSSVSVTEILSVIWVIGMALMIAYGIFSYLKMKKSLRTATKYKDNIYRADNIRSPFIFGIFTPTVYIPYGMSEEEESYVILHEYYHLKRKDYLIKVFAYFLLCIHWMNPLCWISYALMSKDLEMSCDEHVLQAEDISEVFYSNLLLSFASGRHNLTPVPLAFGENSVKSRIKNSIQWKKTEEMDESLRCNSIVAGNLRLCNQCENRFKGGTGDRTHRNLFKRTG